MRKFNFRSFLLPSFYFIFINDFLNFAYINGMNNKNNDAADNFINEALFRGMEAMKEWHQRRQPCHENFAKIPAHLDGDGRWKWEQHSISIQIDGGAQKQFVFREFAPDLFCHLRTISHIDHRQYFASLTQKRLSTWITPTGSGSQFWITADHHFMLKSLLTNLDEQNFLKDQLAEHAKYLASVQARSFIPRFVGLYGIEIPSSPDEPIWIVAMQNILIPIPTKNPSNSNNSAGGLSQALSLDYRFDLKCCSYGRRVPPEELTKAEPTFQDWEFNGRDNEDGMFPNGIMLDEESYKLVAEIIEKDTKFLARIGVLDYSLLIGIHFNDDAGVVDEQSDIRQTHSHKAIGQTGAIIQARCFGCKLPKNIADKLPKKAERNISILVGFVDIILRWNWRFQAKVTKRCYLNKECKEFEQALVNSENYAFRLKCVANRDVFRVQEERKMKKFAEKYCEDYNKIDWENKQK